MHLLPKVNHRNYYYFPFCLFQILNYYKIISDQYYNDELYHKQWQLAEHNIQKVWKKGYRLVYSSSITPTSVYSGKNVIVVVADDGLDWNHVELRDNYR